MPKPKRPKTGGGQKGPELSPEVKRFIVVQLACYERPVDIAEMLLDQFNVDVTLPQLSYYNPRNSSSKGLAKELVDLFEHTRAAYREETEDVPIAQKAWRLRLRERAAVALVASGAVDPKVARAVNQLLDSAAREEGGKFEDASLRQASEEHAFYVEIPKPLTADEWAAAYAPKAGKEKKGGAKASTVAA